MLKLSLLQKVLLTSISLSAVSCTFIQKTKKYFKHSKYLTVYSLIVNIIMGLIFCKTFSTINFPESLWVGLFSFLGADTIYKSLEGKLLKHDDLLRKKEKI